ncbi:pentapeptide repeat-containing protein [Porifericola rhodea]|uniref:pentapeptide repeat-containing protein n=1 Tax=Porifericola rhodea TaxID=930972 RepID=UPI00266626B0|nr:pentapeptide repeat-containing protein [Porifericola rhodea]WKN32154.1 pentapeptide repeat-containing protein [Porifericola rhodea]
MSFKETDFDSLANFTGVNFGSEAIFEKTKFISKADFNRSFFKSNVSLKNVVFGSSGSFSDAKFGGEVLLDSCLLPDTLYFNSVETAKEIDFTYALTNTLQQSNKKCVIDLYGTDIQKLKFDYSRFKVLTDSSKYNKAQLSNIYQQLLKMQRDKGFTDGEEDVDKEYRHFKLTYDKAGFAYLLGAFGSWIQRVWWDYGYHKELIVLWTIVFLLFFTFINIFLFTYLNEKVYKIENIYNPEKYRETSNSISKRSPILTGISLTWFSTLMKSFFYTSLIFFGLKLSIEKIHFEHPGGAMYLIIQYTLGLVCLAYLANFIILS